MNKENHCKKETLQEKDLENISGGFVSAWTGDGYLIVTEIHSCGKFEGNDKFWIGSAQNCSSCKHMGSGGLLNLFSICRISK